MSETLVRARRRCGTIETIRHEAARDPAHRHCLPFLVAACTSRAAAQTTTGGVVEPDAGLNCMQTCTARTGLVVESDAVHF